MRLAVTAAAFAVMAVFEILIPNRTLHFPKIRRFAFHILLSAANTLIVRFIALTPLVFLIEWRRTALPVLPVSGPAEIFFILFLYDGFNYVWHRMNHEVPFLWYFHRAHHTDTDLDVSTALRFHPVELLLSMVFKAFFILLFAPTLTAFVVMELSVNFFAMFHHANIKLPQKLSDVLEKGIITPLIHTGHHTISRLSRDANYGTILTVWDRLCRTLVKPTDQALQTLGVEGDHANPLNPIQFLIKIK